MVIGMQNVVCSLQENYKKTAVTIFIKMIRGKYEDCSEISRMFDVIIFRPIH